MSDSIDKEEVEKVEEAFVSKKAYEDVSSDMHKFKSKSKDAEARANELEAQLKAVHEEKMAENNQWKELAENRAEELENFKQEQDSKRDRYINVAKKSALKSQLGDIRDEYLAHADIASITINDDGTVNSDSVHQVANSFREKHAVLIPKAVENTSTSIPANVTHDFSTMTQDELIKEMQGKTVQERIALAQKYKNS